MLKILNLSISCLGWFWEPIKGSWYYTPENILGWILFMIGHIGFLAGCLVGAAEI
jgi:hypothetical protein